MRWREGLALAALTGGAAAVVAAASTGSAWTAAPASELRVVSAADVDSLDPALVDAPLAWNIAVTTCTTLFVQRPGRGLSAQLVPEAAAGFPEISRDRLGYVFTVRPGLRFADGSPLTAAAFARGIGRVLDPRMHAPAAPQFAAAIASVHARGDRLLIRLARPRGDLLALLTMPWACPVPPGLPTDPNGAGTVVGSGPYAVAEDVPRRELVLERNPFYRGPRPRRPVRIVVTLGGTTDYDVSAVENGAADLDLDLSLPTAEPVPPQLLADLAARYGVGRRQFFVRPLDETVYLALNTSRPLFHDNAPLRRAVNYALDRPEIVRQGGPLAGRRTDQLLPPGTLGFHDVQLYPLAGPDLKTARRLATGHLRDRKAVLYVADAPVALRRAAIIRYNLAQIGLEVEVRSFARPVLISRAATRGEPFDLVLTGWTGFTPDPADFLVRSFDGAGITSTDNFNLSYLAVPDVDRRLAAAAAEPAPARYAAFAAIEADVLRRYAPVAPIMNRLGYVLLSSRIRCFAYDAFGGFDLGSACIG
jgi:peptide/nickel transport system substrate-binding protein